MKLCVVICNISIWFYKLLQHIQILMSLICGIIQGSKLVVPKTAYLVIFFMHLMFHIINYNLNLYHLPSFTVSPSIIPLVS
jgi:hypothetical protein